MNLAQFIAKWNHRGIDFDHAFGYQCVDLADQYIYEVWKRPVFYVTGAVDMYGHDPTHIEWFANDVGNAKQHPIAGDIVIWHLDYAVGTGVLGHVDVWVNGDGYTFNGFDQNWPLHSIAHIQHHTYEGVKGWGRLRSVPHPNPPEPPIPPPSPVPPLPVPVEPHPPGHPPWGIPF